MLSQPDLGGQVKVIKSGNYDWADGLIDTPVFKRQGQKSTCSAGIGWVQPTGIRFQLHSRKWIALPAHACWAATSNAPVSVGFEGQHDVATGRYKATNIHVHWHSSYVRYRLNSSHDGAQGRPLRSSRRRLDLR
jgi:hypothetical protein